jgi:sortase A
LLGYCGFFLADAWSFQWIQRKGLDRLLREQSASRGAIPGREIRPSVKNDSESLAEDLIGRIEIPRLGVSVMLADGIDEATLRHAAGHIPGTALPGTTGNVGIAGHRDTFFRPLREIRRDDIVTLITRAGKYSYRVVSTRVVAPTEVSVLAPADGQVLTLVTCYPFHFVGPAPNRFIVRAERVALVARIP